MDKKVLVILATLIIAFVGFAIYAKSDNNEVTAEPSQHIYGKADSKVTLVEYGDFQCPACFKYEPVLQQVREKYKDQIAFQFRNFPLASIHPNALAAHTAAEAAGRQGKFWEYHDLLYQQQQMWANVTPENRSVIFEGYAQQLGLNMEQFKTDQNDPQIQAVIRADMKAGRELGAQGTPTFILDGKKVDKVSPTIEDFSRLIDAELAKTQ